MEQAESQREAPEEEAEVVEEVAEDPSVEEEALATEVVAVEDSEVVEAAAAVDLIAIRVAVVEAEEVEEDGELDLDNKIHFKRHEMNDCVEINSINYTGD